MRRPEETEAAAKAAAKGGEKGRESGPFSAAALDLARRGLVVLPTGGIDGKRPLVRWEGWKAATSAGALVNLLRRFPTANIGIVCGERSGVTIVDNDDPKVVADMLRRCGETPLRTSTPSGGLHLWYRYAGERSTNLRAESLPVDVKAAGGMVVVPPSIRPLGAGPYGGNAYGFAEGCWDDLARLPTARPGSLPLQSDRGNGFGGRVPVGLRGDELHRRLLREVKHCDTPEQLQDVAETLVARDFDNPQDDPVTSAVIRKTVASVWRYEQEGRNWVGSGEAHIVATDGELDLLKHNADAFLLLSILLRAHGGMDGGFALSAKAMAASGVLPRWSAARYRQARNWLLANGFLRQLHQGGHGRGDPDWFCLSSPLSMAPK